MTVATSLFPGAALIYWFASAHDFPKFVNSGC